MTYERLSQQKGRYATQAGWRSVVSALPHLTLGLQAEVIIGSAPGGITEKATCISPFWKA